MASKQSVVMWSGITLIILRFFTTSQFRTIWGDIIYGDNPGKIAGKVPESSLDKYGIRGGNTRPGGVVLGGPMNSSGQPGSGYLNA